MHLFYYKFQTKPGQDWFGLWCFMPLSTIFQLYRGDSEGQEDDLKTKPIIQLPPKVLYSYFKKLSGLKKTELSGADLCTSST